MTRAGIPQHGFGGIGRGPGKIQDIRGGKMCTRQDFFSDKTKGREGPEFIPGLPR